MSSSPPRPSASRTVESSPEYVAHDLSLADSFRNTTIALANGTVAVICFTHDGSYLLRYNPGLFVQTELDQIPCVGIILAEYLNNLRELAESTEATLAITLDVDERTGPKINYRIFKHRTPRPTSSITTTSNTLSQPQSLRTISRGPVFFDPIPLIPSSGHPTPRSRSLSQAWDILTTLGHLQPQINSNTNPSLQATLARLTEHTRNFGTAVMREFEDWRAAEGYSMLNFERLAINYGRTDGRGRRRSGIVPSDTTNVGRYFGWPDRRLDMP